MFLPWSSGRPTGANAANIAFKKPAMQRDNDYKGYAAKAVDGDTEANYFKGQSCTHTQAGLGNNWWAVDLQARYSISSVVLYNRNLYGERLSNFDVVVLNSQPVTGTNLLYTKSQVCAHQDTPVKTGGFKRLACTKKGRFLAIVKSGKTYLTLCEVQVFGELGEYILFTVDSSF
ncbi:fucolectin-like [Lineus longissimus]|uniref:fucolectin-like n=1 Tax=Lineus longissimus TaxID=88925 RepID=UPI00315D4541